MLSIFWLVKMGVSARELPVFCQRVKAWIYGLLINEDSLLYGYLEDTYYVSENVRRQSPSSTPPHPTPVQTLMPSSMHCLTMRFLFYFLFISFFFYPQILKQKNCNLFYHLPASTFKQIQLETFASYMYTVLLLYTCLGLIYSFFFSFLDI